MKPTERVYQIQSKCSVSQRNFVYHIKIYAISSSLILFQLRLVVFYLLHFFLTPGSGIQEHQTLLLS